MIERGNYGGDAYNARLEIERAEKAHQDFRLQNDREWRAKIDHLKAELADLRVNLASADDIIAELRQANVLLGQLVKEEYDRALAKAKGKS